MDGPCLGKVVFKIVKTILWKSERPVSTVAICCTLLLRFVNTRSMHLGD